MFPIGYKNRDDSTLLASKSAKSASRFGDPRIGRSRHAVLPRCFTPRMTSFCFLTMKDRDIRLTENRFTSEKIRRGGCSVACGKPAKFWKNECRLVRSSFTAIHQSIMRILRATVRHGAELVGVRVRADRFVPHLHRTGQMPVLRGTF